MVNFLFQSTHPMRGATCNLFYKNCGHCIFQSTHPMRGATHVSAYATIQRGFQSTHPMRGATLFVIVVLVQIKISIHAPHAGCDFVILSCCSQRLNFNPRTPCGVRQADWTPNVSTDEISIHAPHAGCDSKTRQNHHVPLHKTYIVYQIFISLALYLLIFFKQKIKNAQNSGAKSFVLLCAILFRT